MDWVDTVTRVVFVSFVYALAFGTFPGPAPAIHIGPPWSKSGLLLTCTLKIKDIYNQRIFLVSNMWIASISNIFLEHHVCVINKVRSDSYTLHVSLRSKGHQNWFSCKSVIWPGHKKPFPHPGMQPIGMQVWLHWYKSYCDIICGLNV